MPRRGKPPNSADANAPRRRLPAAAESPALWLYGRHAVLAAVANPARRIRRLIALPETVEDLAAATAAVDQPRPLVETVDRNAIARLLPAQAVHQGFAAVVEPLATVSLDDLLDQPEPLPPTLVVLDQVEDPRNVGAIIRLAAAFRAGAVVVQDRHAPSLTGALAKAASGGLETVPFVRVINIARALADLNDAGYTCLGLDAEAPLPLAAAMPSTPVALVLGSEGRGLRRLVRERCQGLARIPIDPAIESLNVAAAAAIALYERARCLAAEP
jgi:23S rRNA (guanosine2251-2'-O)-methyltransferase